MADLFPDGQSVRNQPARIHGTGPSRGSNAEVVGISGLARQARDR
jgi:hypothetical protein